MFETPIFQMTSDKDINGPDARQHRVIHGHARRKPNQTQEAQIDRVPKKTVRAARLKFPPRQRLAAEPVQPLRESGLIAQSGQIQTVQQRAPGRIQSDAHRRGPRAVQLPDDALRRLPVTDERQQRDTRGGAEQAAVKRFRQDSLQTCSIGRPEQHAMHDRKLQA